MKFFKVTFILILFSCTFNSYGEYSDPLNEYLKLEKKYFLLLEKLKTYTIKTKKLKSEIKKIEEEYARLQMEKRKMEREIKKLGNFDPTQTGDIALLLAIFYPKIREIYMYESELAMEVNKRLKNLYTMMSQMKKIDQRKKQKLEELKKLTILVKETLREIKEERSEKLNLIRRIFSNKKMLKEYMAMRRKNIESINITYEKTTMAQFSEKIQLEVPVKGKIVKPYGYYFDPESKVELFSPGIEIKTLPLTLVKSIYSGFVEFSGPLEGYDYVVLIRHPGNYFSVYGHLEMPIVKKDDFIERGQIIGVVADYGENSTLYFEIRKGETPINPLKFIHFQKSR